MIKTTQTWKIGDCLELMPTIGEDSVDLIVTDPPYGYSFMGKDWDKSVPSVDIWQECLRILKPGAFAFIMSAPRQDVLAHNLVNLSDAGFETGFTSIYWTFASGFPKAGNISKLIDKRAGVEREVIGNKKYADGKSRPNIQSTTGTHEGWKRPSHEKNYSTDDRNITAPATPEAKALDGSYAGFQPKPAVEVIMVVMKPLSEETYVDQALVNGKGITWLDDGRIPYQSDVDIEQSKNNFKPSSDYDAGDTNYKLGMAKTDTHQNMNGRFPANLLVSDDVLNDGNITTGSDAVRHNNQPLTSGQGIYGKYNQKDTTGYADSGSFSRYFDLDAWFDTKFLPKEAQKTFPFVLIPKASKSEKGKDNKHPTVKPVKLFTWLMTIGSREGDLVYDPFLGTAPALAAGRLTNRNVFGCDIDPQWEHLYPDRCLKHTPTLQSYFDDADDQ